MGWNNRLCLGDEGVLERRGWIVTYLSGKRLAEGRCDPLEAVRNDEAEEEEEGLLPLSLADDDDDNAPLPPPAVLFCMWLFLMVRRAWRRVARRD